MPYNTQLVPLAALYVELGDQLAPAMARAKLERWFWSGIFGEVYGGAVETQFGLDLAQVADWVRGGVQPVMVSEANFIPERLLSLRTRNSAAYKGLYALQMKSGASDWRTGEQLAFATWHQENIDIHHIFPVAWCGKANPPVPPRLYNSIINKTPIDAATNRKIGGNAPSVYLRRLENDISEDDVNVTGTFKLRTRRILAPQFTTVLRSCLDRYSAVAKPVPAAGRAHDPRVAWLPEPKARAAMKIQEAGRHAAYGGHTPAIPISTEKEWQPTLLPQRQMSHSCPATLNAPSQHAVNDRISTSIG